MPLEFKVPAIQLNHSDTMLTRGVTFEEAYTGKTRTKLTA